MLLNAKKLCWEHTVHFMCSQHMPPGMKKIHVSETLVNLVYIFSLVWLKQTFTHSFTKRLINEANYQVRTVSDSALVIYLITEKLCAI